MKAKRRPTAENILKAVNATRRNNIRKLIGPEARFKTQGDLASELEVTDSYLSQLIGPNPSKKVTEPTARKFEYKLGMRSGDLDRV